MNIDFEKWTIAKSRMQMPVDFVDDDDREQKTQEYEAALEEYKQVAEWCNAGGEYHIEDCGEYYATAKNPEPSEEELKQREIAELKQFLADTDYVVIKIAEGSATAEEYAEIIEQRKQARARINELEGNIEESEE